MLTPDFPMNSNTEWRVNIDLSKGQIVGREEMDVFTVLEQLACHSVPVCLVDIDRSKGFGTQYELIAYLISKQPGYYWIAGGLTTLKQIEELLTKGARGCVIGSAALEKKGINRLFLKGIIDNLSRDCFCISLDFRGDTFCTYGFTTETKLRRDDILEELYHCVDGRFQVQIVDINASILRKEPQWEFIQSLPRTYPECMWWYAGNLRSWDDMQRIIKCGVSPCVGKAYLQGELGLERTIFP